MRILFLIVLISLIPSFYSQLVNSKHPIIIIDTQGDDIMDEPKIESSMGIIYNGPGVINNINDSLNHYNGNIGIETRGNSTQGFDKKTYSIELRDMLNQDTSVNLLGMGKEEDWILHAMVIDKSQVRIPMSSYFFQRMGHYAYKWRYVELIINNEYRGLYILTEKIKRDDDRVDISKLDDDDLLGDSVTGGYILRIDWLDNPNRIYF
jgi:CotH protein.